MSKYKELRNNVEKLLKDITLSTFYIDAYIDFDNWRDEIRKKLEDNGGELSFDGPAKSKIAFSFIGDCNSFPISLIVHTDKKGRCFHLNHLNLYMSPLRTVGELLIPICTTIAEANKEGEDAFESREVQRKSQLN